MKRYTKVQFLKDVATEAKAAGVPSTKDAGEDALRQSGYYILIAYRYGHREGHSYLVDWCKAIDISKEKAEAEVTERGGKYSVVVFAKSTVTGKFDEVYEAKCPEHYTKGTHPFISKIDHDKEIAALKQSTTPAETLYRWVKATGPIEPGDRTRHSIRHIGQPEIIKFIDSVWYWEDGITKIRDYQWTGIEYLVPDTQGGEANFDFTEWATDNAVYLGYSNWKYDRNCYTTAQLYQQYLQSK